MKLQISEKLDLPINVVTQKLAILGTSGSGKSYTAMKLAELMLDAGAQIVAVDPVGIWWSLRLAADGKADGYKQVHVFGGDHGDVPLTPESGTLIGRMLAERRISAVLDISQFTTSETKRFAAAFAEQFFQSKKANRSPVHLFLEECQTILPQKPEKDEGIMLNRWERLIKIGRNYGAGSSMISQQPQSVNKKVLNLADTMFAMRTIGHHERQAIMRWVQDVIESETSLVANLPRLATGVAHIWSPYWLKISHDIRILPRNTFDAGKTPEMGMKTVEPRPLTSIDVEKLRAEMAEMIEKVKQDDPKELRKQIQQLKSEAAKRRPTEIKEKIVEKIVEVPALKKGEIEQMQKALAEALRLGEIISKITNGNKPVPTQTVRAVYKSNVPQRQSQIPVYTMRPQFSKPSNDAPTSLREGARRMLAALCQFSPGGMPDGRLRSHAGLKKSGTYSAYKSDLFKNGYIEKRGDDLFATQAGIDYFGGDIPAAPQTTEEVVSLWSSKLREGARRMLDRVISYGGEAVPHEQIYEESGLVKSGTASAYLSDLKRAQLVIVNSDGIAANTETLFL